MYTDRVKEYDIDLVESEKNRWREVIEAEQSTTHRLALAAMNDLDEVTWLHRSPILQRLFYYSYKMYGGLYCGEIKAWAKVMGVSTALAAFINCTYELFSYGDYIGSWRLRPFGCTTGTKWIPGKGMVHVRSMDWPVTEIGRATRVFHFHYGDRRFLSVGVPGMVSVISGMLPGAYSITINWAPAYESPSFSFGPSFLVREVLATCDTYDEAVKSLCEEELAASVFFMVCGTEPGEACLIERSPTEYAVRECGRGTLTHANHYMTPGFEDHNESLYEEDPDEEGTVIEDSTDRMETLRKELKNAKTLEAARDCLDVYPVCNDQSFQQMMFCPATGEYDVWRWA